MQTLKKQLHSEKLKPLLPLSRLQKALQSADLTLSTAIASAIDGERNVDYLEKLDIYVFLNDSEKAEPFDF